MVDVLVGHLQSTFIEGRSILDNVVVLHDLSGAMGKNTSPRCFMKIDIRKAYDSVEWGFLQMILTEFGFPSKMIDLIMTSMSYSLLVNGSLIDKFSAKKGLRQGDPTSLFYLCWSWSTSTNPLNS